MMEELEMPNPTRRNTPAALSFISTALAFMVLLGAPPSDAEDGAVARPLRPASEAASTGRIVNGVGTNLFPHTVSLISGTGRQFCTGTLIGCNTVLTRISLCLRFDRILLPGGRRRPEAGE